MGMIKGQQPSPSSLVLLGHVPSTHECNIYNLWLSTSMVLSQMVTKFISAKLKIFLADIHHYLPKIIIKANWIISKYIMCLLCVDCRFSRIQSHIIKIVITSSMYLYALQLSQYNKHQLLYYNVAIIIGRL